MEKFFVASLTLSIIFLTTISTFGDSPTTITTSLQARDIVYSHASGLLYASVPSSAGQPNGNSILTIDPATLAVIDRIAVGSEPNRLAISRDGSRIYVGIDGARAFRYFEPGTGKLGPLNALTDFGPAVVEEFAVVPDDPRTVIVSADSVASSLSGDIQIFDDSGKIGAVPHPHDAGSMAFVDGNTFFGYDNSNTGFDNIRFRYADRTLTFEREAGAVISGFGTRVEASGGLIFATSGQVLNPRTLGLLGRFNGVFGPVEASVIDGRAYFLQLRELKVFDTGTFLELDTHTLDIGLLNARALIHAGAGRLAFVQSDGTVGVIKGITLSPKPASTMGFVGTGGDDELIFDLENRAVTFNGNTASIPFEVNRYTFDGLAGEDRVICYGKKEENEVAFFRDQQLTMRNELFHFAASNCEDIAYVADSDGDIAVLFDSESDDRLDVSEGNVVLDNGLAQLKARRASQVFVYSSGQMDKATIRGNAERESVNLNLQAKRIRFSNPEYVVVAVGFPFVQVNAGAIGEDDWLSGVDSSGDDSVYALGDYMRVFNESVDYSFKGFEKNFMQSNGGNDWGGLQKIEDSIVRQNERWKRVYGTGYDNNLTDFSTVRIRD